MSEERPDPIRTRNQALFYAALAAIAVIGMIWELSHESFPSFASLEPVSGRMLRSYAQVKQSVADDHAWAPIVIAAMAAMGGYFLFAAFRAQRSL